VPKVYVRDAQATKISVGRNFSLGYPFEKIFFLIWGVFLRTTDILSRIDQRSNGFQPRTRRRRRIVGRFTHMSRQSSCLLLPRPDRCRQPPAGPDTLEGFTHMSRHVPVCISHVPTGVGTPDRCRHFVGRFTHMSVQALPTPRHILPMPGARGTHNSPPIYIH
jgi:hypothetical protein